MIDLHIHTRISDGSLSASEVIRLAKEKNIGSIAITDHDTTKGLSDAVSMGLEFGVKVIPGIEISAYDYKRNKKAHIIGLFIEPENKSLKALCKPLSESRHEASKEMVDIIGREGYKISWPEVESYAEGGTGVYKQHIMHALIDKGYCKNIYCDLYKMLFKKASGTETGGIAYIPLKYIDAEEAIRTVREAGGIAVLAHPGQLKNFDAVEEWAKIGLEGIEAFHPDHNEEDIEKSLDFARKFGLITTGGSDFHGFYGEKPVELGCSKLGADCIDELEVLKSRRL